MTDPLKFQQGWFLTRSKIQQADVHIAWKIERGGCRLKYFSCTGSPPLGGGYVISEDPSLDYWMHHLHSYGAMHVLGETSIQCIQCRTDSHNLFGVRIAHLPGDPADGKLFCLGFSHGCVPHEAIWGPGWISFGAGKWCRELDMGPVEHQGNSRAPCAFAT